MEAADEDYGTLGIARGADPKQVRAAWMKVAQQWHPDLAPPELAEEYAQRFKAAKDAYTRILDSHDTRSEAQSVSRWMSSVTTASIL